MARTRNPRNEFREACVIAQESGLRIQPTGNGFYQVWRSNPNRPEYLGQRATPAALRALVCQITHFR